MTVTRIVTDIATDRVCDGQQFYGDLLGLKVVTDHGWIVTFASDQIAPVQVSIASEGGSGAPVPDISIEVDDVDEIHRRAQALGFEITYPPTDEPWGVRRFLFAIRLENWSISSHIQTSRSGAHTLWQANRKHFQVAACAGTYDLRQPASRRFHTYVRAGCARHGPARRPLPGSNFRWKGLHGQVQAASRQRFNPPKKPSVASVRNAAAAFVRWMTDMTRSL